MNPVLRVERKGYNTILVEWDTPGYVKLYKHNIEAGEHVFMAETNAGIYIDEDAHGYINVPTYTIVKNDEEIAEATEYSVGDFTQYAIADNYMWQLRYLPRGYKVKMYLVERSDNHCPECYNEILKKRVKTVCDTCDGTGMLNSIKGPVETYMGIAGRRKENTYSEMQSREEETINAWTGNYPHLKQGDVVVHNGLMYTIQNIPNHIMSPSESSNKPFVVRQEFVLVRLDKNHELYRKIEV